mgnify:CR=1 FL=1
MARPTFKLTDPQIRNAKPKAKVYRLPDGKGLYLLVDPNGYKYWRYRYRFNGKEFTLAIGVYPTMTLSEARTKHAEECQRLAAGENPSEVRRKAKMTAKRSQANSFESIARQWYAEMKDTWRNEKHRKTVIRTLEQYIFPKIGLKPVDSIDMLDLRDVIKDIESTGTVETAKRTAQRVERVFAYALDDLRLISNNPATNLYRVVKSNKKGEYSFLLAKDLAPFIQKLDSHPGEPTTIFAIKLLMLTFVRPGELRGARWDEFEFEEKLWRIPAHRMKRDVEHLVPLSEQTQTLLEQLRPHTGHYELLFPGRSDKSKPIGDATMNRAIKRLGFDFVGHGFRKTASTWLHENGYDPQAIERQLAHNEQDKTKAAYNKAQHLDKRREMMQAWGCFIRNCSI